jgi:hypothetical protein
MKGCVQGVWKMRTEETGRKGGEDPCGSDTKAGAGQAGNCPDPLAKCDTKAGQYLCFLLS